MKIINWLAGLSVKTKILSVVVAGGVVVGSGVGVGMTLNKDNNSASDSSTSIEASIDSSIEDSSVLDSSMDSSVETSSSVESSNAESTDDSSDDSSSDSAEDFSDDSSSDSAEDFSDDSSLDSAEDFSDDGSSDSFEPAPHEHDFRLEIIENTYLKAEATCESKAVYYYACACGEHSEKTFEYGTVLGHDTAQHEAQAVTCTEKGWAVYETCNRCNYTTYAEIQALGHDKITDLPVPATCSTTGLTEGSHCSRCNVVIVEQEVASKLAHTPTTDAAVESTCSATGLTEGSHCSICNEIIVAQEEVGKKAHIFSDWITDTEATCSNLGARHKECIVCQAVLENGSIDKLAHTPAIDAAVGATCTETGLTEGSHCSACDTVIVAQEEVATKPHTVSEWRTDMDATCSLEGIKHKECIVCHTVLENGSIDKLAHTPTTDAAVEATCTETGLTEGSHCSVCNTVIVAQEVAPKKPHTVSEWLTYTEETCSVKGIKYKKCTVCHDILETAWVDKLAHTPVIDAAVEATCTITGRTEGSHCSVCDTVIVAQEVLPKKPHTASEWIIDKQATCLVEGKKHTVCSVCGITVGEETWIGDHDYETTIVPPTAIAQGYSRHVCAICDDFYYDAIVPSLGFTSFAYRLNEDETTCTIIGLGGVTETEIEIPLEIDGYAITAIGEEAFANCTELTEILLHDFITTIGARAFYGCTGLTEFTIPEGVSIFGAKIFDEATNLTTIYYNSSYGPGESNPILSTSSIEKVVFGGTALPQSACRNITNLKEVVILDSIEVIPEAAFEGCSNLVKVCVGNGVSLIEDYAFSGCSELEEITLGSSVRQLGTQKGNTFTECVKLEKVYFMGSIEEWCQITYAEISSGCMPCQYGADLYINGELLTDIIIPDTITVIHDNAFYNCQNVESITLPNSITEIGDFAFYNCKLVTSLLIPDSVTTIGEAAFFGCDNLVQVVIPDSVSSVGSSIFGYNLFGVIYCAAESQPEGWDSVWCDPSTPVVWDYSNNDVATNEYTYAIKDSILYGIKADEATLLKAWKEVATACIPETIRYKNVNYAVTSISAKAFSNCGNLASVTLPDTVISIGDYAFEECSSLTSVVVGGGVTSFGENVFRNCNSLAEMTLPFVGATKEGTSNTHFGYIFGGGNELVPNSLKQVAITHATSIAASAFAGCSDLTSIELLDNITSLGEKAFENCTSLTTMEIPDSVTMIGTYLFSGCSSLTSIEIPDGVTTIREYTFYNCSSLTSVVIPDSVTFIDSYAFSGCSSLTEITIGEGVTAIGTSAFSGCVNLASITFEDASGWYRTSSAGNWNGKTGGSSIDVTDPSDNVTEFMTAKKRYWYKI